MNISTKLRLSSVATTLFVLLFICVTLSHIYDLNILNQKQQLSEGIISNSFQLIALRDEYIWHPSVELKAQWMNQYTMMMKLFIEAKPLFAIAEEHTLFEKSLEASVATGDLYHQLVQSIEQRKGMAVTEELKTQLSLIARNRVSNMLRLSDLIRTEERAIERTFLSIMVLLGAIIVLLSLLSYLISRSMSRALLRMTRETQIFGAGNLQHRIPIVRQDEIGNLEQQFNAMAQTLEDFTAGLARKIAEKTKELDQKVHEVGDKNSLLEESKRAMQNLLEDLQNTAKRLEQESINARKFEQAVQASGDAIAIALSDLTYIYVNPAWCHSTGYSPKEVLGQNPHLVLSNKMNAKLMEQFFARREEEAVFHSDEFIFRRKDGTEYEAEEMEYCIREQGKTLFKVFIHRNISERKRADRAKTEYISLASHQLRTPLTEIRWALSNLKQGSLPQEQRMIVEAAHQAAGHMAETIKAMLTISHMETGELKPEPTDAVLQSVFNDILHLYDTMRQEKALKLTVDCPESIRMHADAQLLKEILSNLVTNAYKYTPAGGSVRIAVRKDAEHVTIEIADTGCGIPQSDQRRVSEKFFRASNVLHQEQEGSGIGLHMTYALTKLLGGTISFVSQEGKGTTFSLSFPASPADRHKVGN
ncbi:MAG: ATP-binding protein [Candidatus Peregrinibacteria bacterium]